MRSEPTPAIAELTAAGIAFRVVETVPASSVEESAGLQGIDLASLVKSLLIRRAEGDYLFVLMPGSRQVSWQKLRQVLGVSRLTMPSAEEAKAVTGYERGAITPLGAPKRLPVFADKSIPDGPVAIGGGARGVNLHLNGVDLLGYLSATIADLSI
jgi:Cys-tRNA(Pro) deacylase